MNLASALVVLAVLLLAACSSAEAPAPDPTPVPATATATAPAATEAPAPATASPAASPSVTPTPAARLEPLGFPIDPATRLGQAQGAPDAHVLVWGAGPAAREYSARDQVSDNPDAANASGWNCRVHQEYEGRPAVDWYIPSGTPIVSTMDGTASLFVISLTNAFDYYGVAREPYIGNPDRANAPLSPFPGPGGGKGVYVEVTNDRFVTEYAHVELERTLSVVPEQAFVDGFSRDSDYAASFSAMRAFDDATLVATWPVRAGDVMGFSGDSGYSEAPHLHYTVRRQGGALLCPTAEAGFEDGGWLVR